MRGFVGALEGYYDKDIKMKLDSLLFELNQIKMDSEKSEEFDPNFNMVRIIHALVMYLNNPKIEAAIDDIAF